MENKKEKFIRNILLVVTILIFLVGYGLSFYAAFQEDLKIQLVGFIGVVILSLILPYFIDMFIKD